jgi:hypothetical protein
VWFLIVTTPYYGYLKNLPLSVARKWVHHHTAFLLGGHIKFWRCTTLTQLLTQKAFSLNVYGRGPIAFEQHDSSDAEALTRL